MKKLLSCLLFFFCLLESHAQISESRTIVVNGQTRSYRIYIPTSYTGNEAVPLIFNFHGYTSNSAEQESYGDFRPIADTANIILIHPQGLNLGGYPGWNSFSSFAPDNYDYVFVEQLLDSLLATYNIDPNRVFSTGMSNGGFMSYDMACFMSHRFTAIASVTGSMVPFHLANCNPQRKVPVMQIHGTADATVAYDGVSSTITSVHIDTLVKFWTEHNLATNQEFTENIPNSSVTDNSTAQHFLYFGASEPYAHVEFFKIQNGGHTWPGANYVIPGVNTNQDFSASVEIWRFFSQFSMDDFPLELKEKSAPVFTVYPNPAGAKIQLQFQNSTENQVIVLEDLQGNKILELNLEGNTSINLDLSKLESGMYFIKSGTFQQKIMHLN